MNRTNHDPCHRRAVVLCILQNDHVCHSTNWWSSWVHNYDLYIFMDGRYLVVYHSSKVVIFVRAATNKYGLPVHLIICFTVTKEYTTKACSIPLDSAPCPSIFRERWHRTPNNFYGRVHTLRTSCRLVKALYSTRNNPNPSKIWNSTQKCLLFCHYNSHHWQSLFFVPYCNIADPTPVRVSQPSGFKELVDGSARAHILS